MAAPPSSARPGGTRPAKKSGNPNQLLIGGLISCAAIVVAVVVSMKLLQHPLPPPPPPPPPTPERSVNTVLRFNPSYFQALVNEDARQYKITAPTLDELTKPLVYTDELAEPKKLRSKSDKVTTAHLALGMKVIKEWASAGSGERYRFEHLVLTITNTSDQPLAYRVQTAVENLGQCGSKGALAHNAIAILPGETIERTECLWHPKDVLTVNKIETLTLLPLGYRYVSRLVPPQVLLDERTAAGHEPPTGVKTCQYVPWREIRSAVKTSGIGWADVMDFYARHNCDEYSFYEGYHRWTAPGALPAHAP